MLMSFTGLKRENLVELERMGEKSADNLLAAIEKSKECDLFRVIYALGIRHIGQKAAKLLADRFGSMEAVMAAGLEEINAIDGFGGIMAESVVRFFALPQSQHFVEQLQAAGVNMLCRTERTDSRVRRHDLCAHRHPASSQAGRGGGDDRKAGRENRRKRFQKDLRGAGGGGCR